ncbi:hypothetical protein M23134_02017 [Microscilla marina ATCC 23134]|uniref:Uncharacterized protein n=1 Tax=Microscilla marina ATCC 23134 TaxID=313606 RepID=A1ZCI6_MICM2|nr:hypothetical protein M23134_02017 [Microscilla marina ATCC 23134]
MAIIFWLFGDIHHITIDFNYQHLTRFEDLCIINFELKKVE